MDHIILHPISKTRILRPKEFKALIEAVPKVDHKDMLETLLFTGARYTEIQKLFKNKGWFHGNSIQMPSFKKKAVYESRYIRLNKQGERAVQHFLSNKRQLPAYPGWDKNLKRWAIEAGLDPTGISVKTTRKTWESWLVARFPQSLDLIYLSQGHNRMTALKFYLMIPFTQFDKMDMGEYTDGWL